MLIKYKFSNGDTSEVEVSDEIGNMIETSRKAEQAQERKERYYCFSLDAIDYEGSEFGYFDDYDFEDEEVAKCKEILNRGFSVLTETQKRRLKMHLKGMTLMKIAEIENASFKAVDESIKAAQKKFQKISKNF